MWSNGNIPFSGGTGLSPLLPPNAPPITQVSQSVKETINQSGCSLFYQIHNHITNKYITKKKTFLAMNTRHVWYEILKESWKVGEG